MRNPRAILAFLVGLSALGALAVGAAATRFLEGIDFEAAALIPVAALLGLAALAFARGARFEYQRTLGRAGGHALAALGRVLGALALLFALTAALALAVFALLVVLEQR